jgi:hypothetical protein
MAASDASVKALQLQISASTELLIRNLKSADSAVADFRRQTDRQLDQIDGRFLKLGESIGSGLRGALGGIAGLVGGVSLFELAKDGLDYASSLGEVSQQLGVTTRDYQVFAYAATQVGVSQEEMEKALSKLTLSIGQAADGAKKQAGTFNELGINVKTAGGDIRSASDIIPELADALAKIPDPAARARIEVELFGKTGQKLDTLLSGGSKAIEEFATAAEKLGLTLSPELIARADAAADKFAEVKLVFQTSIAGAVAENAGAILKLGDAFAGLVGKIGPALQLMRSARLYVGIAQDSIAQYTLGRPQDRAAAATRLAAQQAELAAIQRGPKAVVRSGASSGSMFGSQANPLDVGGALGGIASNRPMAGLNRIASSGGGKPSSPKVASAPKRSAAEKTYDEVMIRARNVSTTLSEDYKSEDVFKGGDDGLAAIRSEIEARMEGAREIAGYERDQELELKRLGEDRILSLADLLEDSFTGRAGSFWDQFKRVGLGVVSQLAARLLTNNGGFGGGFSSLIKASLGSVLGGARANGGPVTAGVPYLVGERGPEIVVPRANATVVANGKWGGGATSMPLTLNMTVTGVSNAAEMHAIAAGAATQAYHMAVAASGGNLRQAMRPGLPMSG